MISLEVETSPKHCVYVCMPCNHTKVGRPMKYKYGKQIVQIDGYNVGPFVFSKYKWFSNGIYFKIM